MSSRAASPRVVVLAAVVALHVGVLVLLIAETRSRPLRGEAETTPLLVWLIEPPHERPPPPSVARAARAPHVPSAPPPEAQSEAPSPAPTPEAPSSTAIDWAAEGAAAANAQVEADTERNRQTQALAPKKSAMFAAQPKRHPFAWNYAATHRVEPLGGLATGISLGDRCGIVLILIIPVGGGCALGKPPARGDLFDHMHDGEP